MGWFVLFVCYCILLIFFRLVIVLLAGDVWLLCNLGFGGLCIGGLLVV